jgi:1,4-dihydroxy-2-naphthoyl-CoA hydrolase
VSVADGRVEARLPLRADLLAPNGYLHAGTVVTLADTASGYGCVSSLPEGATGFTTIELKANFLATATDGVLACEAVRAHGGRTTQVWDATVTHEGGRTIALFRCTQLLLYGGARGSVRG